MNIAIINHSLMDIYTMTYWLRQLPAIQVLWTASTATEALQHYQQRRPHLVLLDIILPDRNIIELMQDMIRCQPCAIALASRLLNKHMDTVFAAMSAGAMDAMNLPISIIDPSATLFLNKLATLTRMIESRLPTPPLETAPLQKTVTWQDTLIAIGASTGGPNAVAQVLKDLQHCAAAIVVIQHIGTEFAGGLAEWLHQQSALPVRLAVNGDILRTGEVLLGAGHLHLVMTPGLTLHYTQEPETQIYRPSVDVFFQSVAQHWPGPLIGVLLTGIGRDGAIGLQTLRQKGCHTIAQDQRSSVVYGMPKAASQLGAAEYILPLAEIGHKLLQWTKTPYA